MVGPLSAATGSPACFVRVDAYVVEIVFVVALSVAVSALGLAAVRSPRHAAVGVLGFALGGLVIVAGELLVRDQLPGANVVGEDLKQFYRSQSDDPAELERRRLDYVTECRIASMRGAALPIVISGIALEVGRRRRKEQRRASAAKK